MLYIYDILIVDNAFFGMRYKSKNLMKCIRHLPAITLVAGTKNISHGSGLFQIPFRNYYDTVIRQFPDMSSCDYLSGLVKKLDHTVSDYFISLFVIGMTLLLSSCVKYMMIRS